MHRFAWPRASGGYDGPTLCAVIDATETFDDAEHAALLSGDEKAVWVCGVMAAVSLVDIGARALADRELFGGGDDSAERAILSKFCQQLGRPSSDQRLPCVVLPTIVRP